MKIAKMMMIAAALSAAGQALACNLTQTSFNKPVQSPYSNLNTSGVGKAITITPAPAPTTGR